MRRILIALAVLAPLPWSSAALAQPPAVVLSPAPASTSVTIYRDPDRGEGRFNLRWLQGYALISEKRRISLPAGESLVRFEGVADGMIAVSAVVSGLPGGVEEKNRDASLLSPAALLDGSLGNRVRLRRTSPATGRVTETEAIVRSGPDQAVVLETPDGVEALRCSGLPETLVYDAVSEGLSAKPVFSVHTNSPVATEAEVTLTYLATGFDWSASYVATLAPDGRTLDLFSWLTVANGNGAEFGGTQLLAVAGRPNRTSDFRALDGEDFVPELSLSCWPMENTSTPADGPVPPPPPPMPVMLEMAAAPMAMRAAKADAIQVTAMARQENLGDLKLYRVPVPVDVVPNGQKQVALLHRESVPFTRFYAATVESWGDGEGSRPLAIMLRVQNRVKDGLGLPLPSGSVAVMQRRGEGDDLLLADSQVADRAVGEKVEIAAGSSDQVRLESVLEEVEGKGGWLRLTLTNALDREAPVEIMVPAIDGYVLKDSGLKAKDGGWLWAVSVPAGGRRSLDLRLRRQ